MKKKVFFASIALTAVVSTAIGIHNINNNQKELLLENVEALSQKESHNSRMRCVREIIYTGGYSMPLHCLTCGYRYGYVAYRDYSFCP